MNIILANQTASMTELKKSPTKLLKKAHGETIAILKRNQPVAYLIPAKTFELLMDIIEDVELAHIVNKRKNNKTIKVDLAEL
jgi:antitoxin StbD